MYVCVYQSMCGYVHVNAGSFGCWGRVGCRYPGARVTGGCELFDLGFGD